MAELCDCDEGLDTHEHCVGCECILTSYESENYCRSCIEVDEDDTDQTPNIIVQPKPGA